MKFLKLHLITWMLVILSIPLFSQSPFTVTKDTLGGDEIKVTIEHQNGRMVEYFLTEDGSELGVNLLNNAITDNTPTGIHNDVLANTIQLPSDDYSSSPIQFFNAGSKIYCFGTHEILVINSGTGVVSNTIPLFDAANFYVKGLLNSLPVNKFITGDNENNRLYCADANNRFYVINTLTDQIIVTYNISSYTDQLSTSTVINQDNSIVYWLVNSWDGTNGTQINAYNSVTGAFIGQRIFSNQIFDMNYQDGGLFITTEDNLVKLNPQNLQTVTTYSETGKKYRKLFSLYSGEIGVSYSYISGTYTYQSLQIFGTTNVNLIQQIALDFEHFIWDVKPYQNEKIVIVTKKAYISRFYFFSKQGGSQYQIQGAGGFPFADLEAKNIRINQAENRAFIGGQDIGWFNLNDYSFYIPFNNKGCESYDIMISDQDTTEVIFSANPIEGTYSRFREDVALLDITQTAFKTNTGCFNPTNNKVYFVNNRIKYEESGLAIVDCSTDDVIDILPLGTFLIQAVYNETVNKVFVASKEDKEIYVIDGQTNQLASTISFTGLLNPIEQIFNTGDKIVCKAYDKVYIVNPSTYSYITITLPSAIASYDCRKMALNENADELYLLLSGGYTKILKIDLATSTLDQTYSFTILNAYDLEYDDENDLVYLANLTLPKFYVLDPSDFSIEETISYTSENLFSTVDIEVNQYRKKAYMTCLRDNSNIEHYLTVINLDDYTYSNTTLDDVKSALTFNSLNERYFHNKLVDNQNGMRELAFGVVRGYNDDMLDDIASGNLLNRPYTIGEQYDDNKPVVNTESNKIYWPNVDFSNISVISSYTDRLGLQSDWNWLSFPRLERAENNPAPVIPVLDNINYFPSVELQLIENGVQYLTYTPYTWSGYLTNVQSTEGYKLDLELLGMGVAPDMKLYGAILDPETPITLNAGSGGNWVGYFIEDAQMLEDAIPAGVLQHVTQIKAQYWSMIRTYGDPEWRYKGSVTPIQYGDMVIIYVDASQILEWNQPLVAAEEMAALTTEYYQFEEQADYLPIFVETDSTSDIQEIAVLANGNVVGAAVRETGDTLTQVSAYLGGVPSGTPLSFETWNGYKSAPASQNNYTVFNPERRKFENRTLYKGENARYHAVSLKQGTVSEALVSTSELSCAPNPFSTETTFTLRVDAEVLVKLTICDINGRQVAELLNSNMPEGLYHVNWDGTADNGINTDRGVYYYSVTINGVQQSSGKVVLIR